MPVSISVKSGARAEMIDITGRVQETLRQVGVKDGQCLVYVPHTTAGVTINEGADPDVCGDILARLEFLVPRNAGYRHAEGNADSHIKTSLMGNSVSVLVEEGSLVLGTWQRIFLCEFDGPRTRRVFVACK
ncbi:secondary thiamine-phosphate synthase enzyme YjbQ [Desulfatiglans anilini]|uniref:secondary thiamine-phosphate synthase enzyme YjbQ n=1 Tax=Desulfatiglans anilini TaxID=90728 RepID=UPI000407B0A4|nr:secondary thiamine-phosphate synthase enzyme YjbQ [Desulfatiglans anilini]